MDLIPAVLLTAAVSQAVLDQGGFRPDGRELFGALAAAAVVAAAVTDPAAARTAARRPVAIVLWVLAGVGAASAAWTEGLVGDSLRWGLVTGGYGAVYVCASVLATRHRHGPPVVAIGIGALATVSAVVGLVAVADRDALFADYVRGTWRPGGTLEYSAGLSLLIVCALPVLLGGMCRPNRIAAAAGAVGGAICAAALALDRSRAELAFAVLIAVAAVALPRRTVRAPRFRAAGAVLALAVAALAARLVAGAPVHLRAAPHTARTLLELVAACLIPALLWMLASRPSRPPEPARRHKPPAARPRSTAIAAGLVLVAVVAAGLTIVAIRQHSHVVIHGGTGGFWHGRLALWHKTIETFTDRPLIGGGADSFLAASIVHQPSSPIRFAHDLPLEFAAELGVGGFLLALALYGAGARELWRGRGTPAAWLLAPAGAAFLAANLIDWPWHLAGVGAVWAVALGALGAPDGPAANPAREPYAAESVPI